MFKHNYFTNLLILSFTTTKLIKYIIIYYLIFLNYSFSSSPISPRFLHFTVQIEKEWLINKNIRILAIFENSKEELPIIKNWQMSIQLFGQNKNEKIPYNTLLNITKGEKHINSKNIPLCLINNKFEENIQIEVELSHLFFYIRSKNSEKYILPKEVSNSSELKVFFIRILYNNNILKEEEKEEELINICQLKSELDYKETSKYFLPSTTPHPLRQLPSTTIKYPLSNNNNIFSNSILNNNNNNLINISKIIKYYKRNNYINKLPRRSTKTAQNYLSGDHYISKNNINNNKLAFRQEQHINNNRKIFPSQNTIFNNWPLEKEENLLNNKINTTTIPSYIDIIKDKQLYEEIQRSKTMELNSRWSLTFLIFVVLISVLISISATFALIMFVLLQCRPKNKKTFLISHS